MATDAEIRTALERARKAIELRPTMTKGTMKTQLRLQDGVKCVARYDDWRFEIDEPTSVGGDETAPSPGVYGMSALAGCVAMSIKMTAAEAGLPVTGVNVEVAADYDDRGGFGIDGVPPGFERFRLKIEIESPAAEADVRALADQAFAISSWFNVFTQVQEVTADVSVKALAAALAE